MSSLLRQQETPALSRTYGQQGPESGGIVRPAPKLVGALPSHSVSPAQKLDAFERLTCEWCEHLTDGESKVLSWLFGALLRHNKTTGYFSVAQMVSGVPKADGSGWWSRGINKSHRDVQRVIKSLSEKGVLITKGSPRGTRFTLVLDWNPEATVVKFPKNVRAKPKNPAMWTETNEPLAEDEEASSYDNLAQRYDNLAQRYDNVTQPATPACRIFIPLTEPSVNSSSVDTTAPPAASRPSLSVNEKINAVIEQAKARSVTKENSARTTPTVPALEHTWTSALRETFPRVPSPVWGGKQRGQAKQLIAKWIDSLGDLHDFVAWSVTNWSTCCARMTHWTDKALPETPDLGFFIGYMASFQNAYADRQQVEWRKGLPEAEQKIRHLMELGYGREAAIFKVAQDEAEAAIMDEADKKLDAARQHYRMADIARKKAEAAPRFTKENPHPRAHEAKPHVLPPPDPNADSYDWNVTFGGDDE